MVPVTQGDHGVGIIVVVESEVGVAWVYHRLSDYFKKRIDRDIPLTTRTPRRPSTYCEERWLIGVNRYCVVGMARRHTCGTSGYLPDPGVELYGMISGSCKAGDRKTHCRMCRSFQERWGIV